MSIRPAVVSAVLLAGLAVGCQDVATDPSAARPGATSGASGRVLVVPDVTGQRWSVVRHRLLELGFANLNLHDATGRDRPVLVARNWIVRAQTPPPGTRGNANTRIVLTVSKPTDQAGSIRTTRGVVPNVVCRDLQAAQDALQAAGFTNLDSRDGRGQGRRQIIDRNWVVTAQSVRPGSRPASDTRIVLTAVKFGEPTGRSGCPS